MFWIIGNKKYDRLRRMEAMEHSIDINSVPRDIEYIKNMFKGFGDNDPENSWLNIDSDYKQL